MIFKRKLSRKRIISLSIIFALLVLCCVAAFWQGLTVEKYVMASDKVSANIRICLITDHHSSKYGKDQKALVSAIDKGDPDVVLIAGDLFDEDRDTKNAEALLKAIGGKYTCFYVTGNHEFRGDTALMKTLVRSYGVTVLEGDIRELTVNGQSISICGVDDLFGFGSYGEGSEEELDACISECYERIDKDSVTVLLTHRPQQAHLYSKYGFDLVLAGHSHGGQVRIPFIVNGLYTPTDGFFPDYAGGAYNISEQTKMIVSRGLCKDEKPRVFNPPELVFIDVIPK